MTEDRPASPDDAEEPAGAAVSDPNGVSLFETRLRETLGNRILEISTNVDELQIRVARDQLVEVCGVLKESEGIDLKYLRCLSVVDWDDDKETEPFGRKCLRIEARALPVIAKFSQLGCGCCALERRIRT